MQKIRDNVFFNGISRTTGLRETQGNNRYMAEITQVVLVVEVP